MTFITQEALDKINHLADRKKRESTADKQLVNGVEALGGLCLKLSSINFSGFPDRTCLLPGGMVIFVELKAPTKKAKGRQKIVHGILRGLGFRVEVLAGVDQVNEFLRELAVCSI